MEEAGNVVIEKDEDSTTNESYHTGDDYWELKRYLEAKQNLKKIFNNPKRAKALREYITSKNQIKDDMKKISEDETYAKGLGL